MSDIRGEPGATADQLPPIKLLFDQNLSDRLPSLIPDVSRRSPCPQLRDAAAGRRCRVGLRQTEWFTITSKDADFHHSKLRARGAAARDLA